jgi:hypothetical protein
VDTDLEELLTDVERKFFSSPAARTLLFGSDDFTDSMLSCGNLAARFEAVSQVSETVTSEHVDLSTMRVADLREELSEYGIDTRNVRKMRKAELVEMVNEERQRRTSDKCSQTIVRSQDTEYDTESCIFLILDENLQRFPFESMPCFGGRTICRFPSLPFALATLEEASVKECALTTVDPSQVSYVIDPESNLSGTRNRLGPVVESLSARHGKGKWEGVVGQVPPPTFMEDRLTTDAGLLLYFGHGGGQQLLSRAKIEGLISGNEEKRRKAKSSVVLMGCSSARLESVNHRKSRTEKEIPIHYEPEGIALSYLSAGAPCVVGNLWDVTDRDIDRFAESLLESFFESEGNRSIAQCLAEARSSCKLRYIVGCAPVCYGIPVFLRK